MFLFTDVCVLSLLIFFSQEKLSFVKQLSYAYGKNRVAPKSMHFYLSTVNNTLKSTLEEKIPSWQSWKNITVLHDDTSYLDKFDKSSLVYLSADSDDVIEELEEGKNYIVGGVVDKNRYKNLCQDKAKKQGIQTGRLPIGNYMQLASRKVLTVNQGKRKKKPFHFIPCLANETHSM